MTKVFISGSRSMNHIPKRGIQALAAIINQDMEILVGDANGMDKTIQQYLNQKRYRNVRVFTASKARNNAGGWPIAKINGSGWNIHEAKDEAMSEECDYGLAFWDSKSRGTNNNINRLRSMSKKVLVVKPNQRRSK